MRTYIHICVEKINRKGIGGFFTHTLYIYIYTHTHTLTHTYIHTYIHTCKQTRIADVKSLGAKVYKDHGLPEATELFRLQRKDFEEVRDRDRKTERERVCVYMRERKTERNRERQRDRVCV